MSDLKNALSALQSLNTPVPREKRDPSAVERPAPASPASLWTPTPEQAAAVAFKGPRLTVEALAGTGKTQVLAAYAAARPRAKWRYLVFNKAMQQAAVAALPAAVAAQTVHGLAFARFGLPLEKKLGRSWNPEAVRRLLDWPSFPAWEVALEALRRMRERFMASADLLPAPHHLDAASWRWLCTHPGLSEAVEGPDGMLRALERLWTATIDASALSIEAPHDAYVKLMQLSGAAWPADGFLIDEAQDLTDCVINMVNAQKGVVIRAGDSHQAIYGWRNVARQWAPPADPLLPLTASFRFGPAIANVANGLLTRLQAAHRLQGLEPSSFAGPSQAPPQAGESWLARTQAGALQAAAAALEAGLKPCWMGAFPVQRWRALAQLAKGLPPTDLDQQDAWLTGMRNLEQLEAAAADASDVELQAAARWAKRQGRNAFDVIEALRQQRSEGDVRVGTVHQTKGWTLESVRLCDDFKPEVASGEEARILYVAATRAKHHLAWPESWGERWFTASSSPVVAPVEFDDGF